MKQFVLGIFIISTFVISPLQTSATTMPCSMVLEPIEAIAWVRKDSSMDLFFNDFADDNEFQALFSDKE